MRQTKTIERGAGQNELWKIQTWEKLYIKPSSQQKSRGRLKPSSVDLM
jgi:hypothetical protein